MKLLPKPLVLIVFCMAFIQQVAAQSEQRIVVPLGDAERQATLEVQSLGDISITAHDKAEIIVIAPDLTDEDPELTVEASDNSFSVATGSNDDDIRLDIFVPIRTSVRASTEDGDLIVQGVAGDHELSSEDGDVTATDISGSVVASSTDGDVTVSFMEVGTDKPISLMSDDGDLDVTFPSSLVANLRVGAGDGDLLTDFDIDIRSQSPVTESRDSSGQFRVPLEREVTALIGGGGPEIFFETSDGDVFVRSR